MGLLTEERSIVVPGEALAEGMDFLPGDSTYREADKIYSKVLGLVMVSGRVIRITPLAGPYVPKIGDKIIGTVKDIAFSGWRVDTGTAYLAMLNVRDATSRFIRKEEDLSKILGIGDTIVVKITNVTSQNLIDLTMKDPGLRRLQGGRIIKINSLKVPRVIGKKGSMISLIKERTGTEITIGQNGFVWLHGGDEYKAEQAIKLIEQKAHEGGLTNKIEEFLGPAKKFQAKPSSEPAEKPSSGFKPAKPAEQTNAEPTSESTSEPTNTEE